MPYPASNSIAVLQSHCGAKIEACPPQPQPRLTPEQYLESERTAQFRSEYYCGQIYARAGGSYQHAQIIGGLVQEFRNALKGRLCAVVPTDLRLRVSPQGLYTYPDVVVICGDPRFADNQQDTLLNPTLIVEVLSPSTEGYDRGFKFAQYRTVESLEEYVLVAQAEPRIEVFRRQRDGHWLLSEAFGLETACRFERKPGLQPCPRRYLRQSDLPPRRTHCIRSPRELSR